MTTALYTHAAAILEAHGLPREIVAAVGRLPALLMLEKGAKAVTDELSPPTWLTALLAEITRWRPEHEQDPTAVDEALDRVKQLDAGVIAWAHQTITPPEPYDYCDPIDFEF